MGACLLQLDVAKGWLTCTIHLLFRKSKVDRICSWFLDNVILLLLLLFLIVCHLKAEGLRFRGVVSSWLRELKAFWMVYQVLSRDLGYKLVHVWLWPFVASVWVAILYRHGSLNLLRNYFLGFLRAISVETGTLDKVLGLDKLIAWYLMILLIFIRRLELLNGVVRNCTFNQMISRYNIIGSRIVKAASTHILCPRSHSIVSWRARKQLVECIAAFLIEVVLFSSLERLIRPIAYRPVLASYHRVVLRACQVVVFLRELLVLNLRCLRHWVGLDREFWNERTHFLINVSFSVVLRNIRLLVLILNLGNFGTLLNFLSLHTLMLGWVSFGLYLSFLFV